LALERRGRDRRARHRVGQFQLFGFEHRVGNTRAWRHDQGRGMQAAVRLLALLGTALVGWGGVTPLPCLADDKPAATPAPLDRLHPGQIPAEERFEWQPRNGWPSSGLIGGATGARSPRWRFGRTESRSPAAALIVSCGSGMRRPCIPQAAPPLLARR